MKTKKEWIAPVFNVEKIGKTLSGYTTTSTETSGLSFYAPLVS